MDQAAQPALHLVDPGDHGRRAIAIAVAVGANTKNASGDLTNNALAGMVPGLLLVGALGVLAMTSEYTSGTIRATLAAIAAPPGAGREGGGVRRW